jgi:hypothetical protein
MHYEKAPPQKVETSRPDEGMTRESLGKSAGKWHFTLRGKTSVGTNELSPPRRQLK